MSDTLPFGVKVVRTFVGHVITSESGKYVWSKYGWANSASCSHGNLPRLLTAESASSVARRITVAPPDHKENADER